jgi:hypothetical protein
MDFTTALIAAIGAESAALVGLFWVYVAARNGHDDRYAAFTEKMLPLLEGLRTTMTETRDLLRKFLTGGPQ